AVMGGLAAIELDLGRARIEARAILAGTEDRPRRRLRNAGENARRLPDEIDPWICGFAALDHDADWDTRERRHNAHDTVSICRIGSPGTRVCGFIRYRPSGVTPKKR